MTTLTQQNSTKGEVINLIQDMLNSVTKKPTLMTKLKSRKFWISLAGILTGIIGMINGSESIATVISFALVEVASILVYCISEGFNDAKHNEQLFTSLNTLISMLDTMEDPSEILDALPVTEETTSPAQTASDYQQKDE